MFTQKSRAVNMQNINNNIHTKEQNAKIYWIPTLAKYFNKLPIQIQIVKIKFFKFIIKIQMKDVEKINI